MTKQPKPWRRAERIAEQCKAGKTLCRFNRQTETGQTGVVFFLEPGCRQVGTRSADAHEGARSGRHRECHAHDRT